MRARGLVGPLLLAASLLVGTGLFGCGGAVTPERWRETVAGMREMVAAAERGDVWGAEAAFNRVHPFFHDVDPPLRAADPTLAAELWTAVLRIEQEFAGRREAPYLAREGRRTLTLLQRVGETLRLEGGR